MAALRIGDVADFPFLDPPDRRAVRDGVALLQELGAFDADATITELGRRLAQLPVDPRIGRMILQAEHEGCVREILVIAAALSIPDPRERPSEHEEAARQKHARFADEHSDFVSYLNLWNYVRAQRKELSGNQFRRMCREEFLHYLRIREWQDLAGQLRSIAASLGITASGTSPPTPTGCTRPWSPACSATSACARASRASTSARATRASCSLPDRCSASVPRGGWSSPNWSRPRGSTAASPPGSNPNRSRRSPGSLVQRTYSEPHWDARRGAAMAYERVTLYGLPIVAAAAGRLRLGRAGRGARAVHPARAGRGRLDDPAPLLPRQPGTDRRAGRDRGAGTAA